MDFTPDYSIINQILKFHFILECIFSVNKSQYYTYYKILIDCSYQAQVSFASFFISVLMSDFMKNCRDHKTRIAHKQESRRADYHQFVI